MRLLLIFVNSRNECVSLSNANASIARTADRQRRDMKIGEKK